MVLALLQGVSELFPISSLGHTILDSGRCCSGTISTAPTRRFWRSSSCCISARRWRWSSFIARSGRRSFARLFASIVRGKLSDDRDERIGWRLVVGTIPVGILGVIFEVPVRKLFGSPAPAALFLVANGLLMFVGEFLRRRQHASGAAYKPIEALGYPASVAIGFAQSFALLPGISRSGISMVAGLLCDLDHENAARYSFLLATPVILAAGAAGNSKALCPRRASRADSGNTRRNCSRDRRISFGRLFDAILPFERSAPVRLVLRRRGRDLLRPSAQGSHHMRVIAIFLAIVFFVLGILYGLGKINAFTESGAQHPHHVTHMVVLWALALLVRDLGEVPKRAAPMKPAR